MKRIQSQSRAQSQASASIIVSALPMFLAHCLFDGDSFDFHEFIARRIHLLGAAWGEEVIGRRIGHAHEHDDVYARIRSSERALKDNRLAARHVELIRSHGTERNHILAETAKYVALLGIEPRDLPCIVCESGVDSRCFAVLRVRPEWYSTEPRARILSEALQNQLGSVAVRGLFPALPIAASELSKRMQGHLDALSRQINQRMRGLATASPRKVKETQLQAEIRRRALVIDRASQRIFVHGKAATFTNEPFAFLAAIAETAASPAAILSRDGASTALWGEAVRSPSALDGVIKRVRRELNASRDRRRGAPIHINTVRGRGWRLSLSPENVFVV